jgi:hypothetical protein
MAKLSQDRKIGNRHPRENILSAGNLTALNSEIFLDCDGCASFSLDLRGTFNLTVEVTGTLDGVNWNPPIPVRPVGQAAVRYVAGVTGTASGVWQGSCAGFDRLRIRVSAYTSGTCVATAVASNAPLDQSLLGTITTDIGTTLGTVGTATTLTLAAPGAGLRHYLTYLSINRFATALLTAGAAPVGVTTTNLPGTLAFSFAADAAAQGTMDRWREDFAYPIASSAQNTATTIVCPATPLVIWRVTAGFYVAP